MTQPTDLYTLPENLPIPTDDGAADHLAGMRLPNVNLAATTGQVVNPSSLHGWAVIYCYPMTGQPGVELPPGWDDIPGARGCTPQACSFRDHYQELRDLGAEVYGLSIQISAYQRKMAERLHLPFPVLSDADFQFTTALRLPTFDVAGMRLLKRLTLITKSGEILKVNYPVFPSYEDPNRVITWLQAHE